MYKEMLVAKMNEEEINITLKRAIERKGGVDMLSEDEAKRMCQRFHIKMADPDMVAWQTYRSITEKINYLRSLMNEDVDCNNLCELFTFEISETTDIENKIEELEKQLEECREAAKRWEVFTNAHKRIVV